MMEDRPSNFIQVIIGIVGLSLAILTFFGLNNYFDLSRDRENQPDVQSTESQNNQSNTSQTMTNTPSAQTAIPGISNSDSAAGLLEEGAKNAVLTVEAMEDTNPGFLLHDTHWQLTSINDFMEGLVSIQETELFRLSFFRNGTLEFETDCILGTANYEVADSEITIEQSIGPDDTSCPERTRHSVFLFGLSNADTFEIDGNQLMIEDFGHRQLFFNQTDAAD